MSISKVSAVNNVNRTRDYRDNKRTLQGESKNTGQGSSGETNDGYSKKKDQDSFESVLKRKFNGEG